MPKRLNELTTESTLSLFILNFRYKDLHQRTLSYWLTLKHTTFTLLLGLPYQKDKHNCFIWKKFCPKESGKGGMGGYASPKFLLLLDSTSLWLFRPPKSVPILHIHMSSVLFKSFSSLQQSSNTTFSPAMASSMLLVWCWPKCLVRPQAVQLLFLISYLCVDHLFFIDLLEPM